jgi:hypothetical protein
MERCEAEVVEQVFAVFEVVQLRARDQQEDRLDARVALAQRAAQRERAFGIVVGTDDRAGPAVDGFVLHRDRGIADRLPPDAREVERLGEQGWRRIGKDQQ